MTSNRFIYFILSAFIVGNLLLIFLQYNSSKNINTLIKGNEKLLKELKVGNQLRELERDILSTEIDIRGAVATNDISNLDGVDLKIAEALGLLDSLKEMGSQDSTLRNINRLRERAHEKLQLKSQILDSFYKAGKLSPESFKKIMQRRNLGIEINYYSRQIFDSRKRLLDSLSISIRDSGRNARTWGTILIVVVLTSGTLLFWYIISRIRKQNHLIHELDISEKKLREVSMIKENFMANMSHEIRTPMNAILGFTNLLTARNRDPELKEFVESIRKSSENLLTLVNDILDLSKIEAGMMRIESAPFSVRGLVHSIQNMFMEKINEKGLQFHATIEDSIPDSVSGDATRLTQILVNMIGNAVKFTAAGTIRVVLTNEGLTESQILLGFAIHDTGIGIAEEKLSGIFERSQQAEDSITRKYGGSGLGLSIVKDLVLLQKGEIKVESEPGKGTSFRFTIPYDLAAGPLAVSQAPEESGFFYSGSRNIRILIVEDNQINQKLLEHLFKEWKLSFDIANNGIDALEKLKSGNYDLVLMDIQMPGMDGYTASQEIRLRLKLDIPIIAMTAHAFAGEREKCLGYGMNEYIAKPISETELNRLIQQFTGIQEGRPGSKKDKKNGTTGNYQFINLEYMQEISQGDKGYERMVTQQFIDTIPLDIEALESALKNRDVDSLRRIAHNMKTNASVMGLSEKLHSFLDEVECAAFDEPRFQQIISSIKTICLDALPEVRHFYSTL